jgi:hypothetical protein
MILDLSLTGYEIYRDTFKCKDVFRTHRLKWNPTKRCWVGKDFSVITHLRTGLKQYRESLHVVTSTYKPKPDLKKYHTKVYGDQQKISALKVLDKAGLDRNICEIIFSSAFRKGFGYSCRCTDKITCSLCYYACCEKATGVFCVCSQATQCPKHGRRCNGSHD